MSRGGVAILLLAFALPLFLASVFVGGPRAPQPVDVTLWIPDHGPETIVVRTSRWEMQGTCFISHRPDRRVFCNVLQVVPCVKDCSPPENPPKDPARVVEN